MNTKHEQDRESATLRIGRFSIGGVDPVCLLALIFSMLAFALVIDCRNRKGELDDLPRVSSTAQQSGECERPAGGREKQSDGVHTIVLGP